MKKKNKILIITVLWIIIIAILYSRGILTTDIDKVSAIIRNNPSKMQVLFVFLSTIRVVCFIPQTIFILIGSALFGPYTGFLLSILSLFLSQSIVYFIGRFFSKELLGDTFFAKYGNIIEIIKNYGYKILVLGIVCPITPSDLITASAGCIKLSYSKCVSAIVLADAPMIFLYGFLGSGIEGNYLFKILAILAIVFISYYSFLIWNKINKSIVL